MLRTQQTKKDLSHLSDVPSWVSLGPCLSWELRVTRKWSEMIMMGAIYHRWWHETPRHTRGGAITSSRNIWMKKSKEKVILSMFICICIELRNPDLYVLRILRMYICSFKIWLCKMNFISFFWWIDQNRSFLTRTFQIQLNDY